MPPGESWRVTLELLVGVQPAESLKSAFFGINFPLKRLLQNLAWGRKSQIRTITRNFAVVAFKM